MENIDILDRIQELINHITDLFWGIGFFGWQISTVYTMYISSMHSILYFIIYLSVFLFSGWMNHAVLKDYIHDPRPKDSIPFLASEKFKRITNGMPSGHAQQTAFSLTFAYLICGKRFYESWLLFLITILQRYMYKNHTLMQLVVGSIIGFILAYITVYFIDLWEKYQNSQKTKKTLQ